MARSAGVRRRGAGWQARVQVGGRDLSATFETFAEAVSWRSEQLARRSRSRAVNAHRQTFDELWEQVYEAKLTRWRHNTAVRNESIYRNYVQPWFGTAPIDKITRTDAAAWVQDMVATGLAPSTIHRVVEVASGCVQWACDIELVDKNPFHRLGLPTVEDGERRFLTAGEAHSIEMAMDPWWALVVPFAFDTGLRISELAGLTVRDIEFNSPSWVVHVRRIVTDTRGHARIGLPKTRAGVRSVPTITRPVAERLAAHIEERRLAPTDSLFAGSHGGVMRPTNWRARVFRPAVADAGLGSDVTPHSLRHGAVARWIAAGQSDPYVLSRWLGHSTPTIVYRTYAHLLPQDTTAITEKMEAEAGRAMLAATDVAPVVPIEVRRSLGR